MSTPCVIWAGYLDRHGYGRIGTKRAHRVAYENAKGPIPTGMLVRHRCDNPPCVNPDHLEVGTRADNMADMKARGRSTFGERNGQAKLTVAQVQQIRTAALSTRKMAAALGVSQTAVQQIRKGLRWGSVQ